jgi:hypothetical protein
MIVRGESNVFHGIENIMKCFILGFFFIIGWIDMKETVIPMKENGWSLEAITRPYSIIQWSLLVCGWLFGWLLGLARFPLAGEWCWCLYRWSWCGCGYGWLAQAFGVGGGDGSRMDTASSGRSRSGTSSTSCHCQSVAGASRVSSVLVVLVVVEPTLRLMVLFDDHDDTVEWERFALLFGCFFVVVGCGAASGPRRFYYRCRACFTVSLPPPERQTLNGSIP